MRYEDILADPVTELAELGEFIGFADPSGWAAQVARPGQPAEEALGGARVTRDAARTAGRPRPPRGTGIAIPR